MPRLINKATCAWLRSRHERDHARVTIRIDSDHAVVRSADTIDFRRSHSVASPSNLCARIACRQLRATVAGTACRRVAKSIVARGVVTGASSLEACWPPCVAPLLAPTFARRREETRHRRARVVLRNSRLLRKGCVSAARRTSPRPGSRAGSGPGHGRGGSDPPNFAGP